MNESIPLPMLALLSVALLPVSSDSDNAAPGPELLVLALLVVRTPFSSDNEARIASPLELVAKVANISLSLLELATDTGSSANILMISLLRALASV